MQDHDGRPKHRGRPAPGSTWSKRGRPGELPREALGAAEQGAELLLMGMRLSEGVDVARFASRLWQAAVGLRLCDGCETSVWSTCCGGKLRATRAGRPLLNAILRELLA